MISLEYEKRKLRIFFYHQHHVIPLLRFQKKGKKRRERKSQYLFKNLDHIFFPFQFFPIFRLSLSLSHTHTHLLVFSFSVFTVLYTANTTTFHTLLPFPPSISPSPFGDFFTYSLRVFLIFSPTSTHKSWWQLYPSHVTNDSIWYQRWIFHFFSVKCWM